MSLLAVLDRQRYGSPDAGVHIAGALIPRVLRRAPGPNLVAYIQLYIDLVGVQLGDQAAEGGFGVGGAAAGEAGRRQVEFIDRARLAPPDEVGACTHDRCARSLLRSSEQPAQPSRMFVRLTSGMVVQQARSLIHPQRPRLAVQAGAGGARVGVGHRLVVLVEEDGESVEGAVAVEQIRAAAAVSPATARLKTSPRLE
eukprot:SAG11_NODE_6413_length_1319_cov_1.120492_1_plen_198_part_00